MDVDALNDRDLLDDTPIGDLVVKYFGTLAGVGICDRHDRERRPRLVHVVDPNKRGHGVLDAIYGKRFFEDEAVVALHDRANEASLAKRQGARQLVRSDMMRGLERFLARGGDEAREALIGRGR